MRMHDYMQGIRKRLNESTSNSGKEGGDHTSFTPVIS